MRLLEPLFNWTGIQASNSAGVSHVVVGKSIGRDDRTEETNTECKTRCTEWNCVWSGLQEAALELSYILKLNTKRKRARQLYQHLAWEVQSRLASLHARSLLDQSKAETWVLPSCCRMRRKRSEVEDIRPVKLLVWLTKHLQICTSPTRPTLALPWRVPANWYLLKYFAGCELTSASPHKNRPI